MPVTPVQPSNTSAPQWGMPLLREMDWKRFQELTSLLLARAGFDSEVKAIAPDSMVTMRATARGKRPRVKMLVHCAAWERSEMGVPQVQEFRQAMAAAKAKRGTLVTPGAFTEDAWTFAAGNGVDLLDGPELLAAVNRMPADEQSYYLRLATVGPWNVPTCPLCKRKMEIRSDVAPSTVENPAQRDVVLKGRQSVGGDFLCRSLTIKRGADILFLYGAEVESMQVHGRVMGNMICKGKLTIGDGGVVSGMVSARSIDLNPGGSLEAEARILKAGEVQAVAAPPPRRLWGCPGYPKCRAVLAVR